MLDPVRLLAGEISRPRRLHTRQVLRKHASERVLPEVVTSVQAIELLRLGAYARERSLHIIRLEDVEVSDLDGDTKSPLDRLGALQGRPHANHGLGGPPVSRFGGVTRRGSGRQSFLQFLDVDLAVGE